MAKTKKNTYKLANSDLFRDGRYYNQGATIELTEEEASKINMKLELVSGEVSEETPKTEPEAPNEEETNNEGDK